MFLMRSAFAAALDLAVVSAAAPVVVADVPGYLFRDFEQPSQQSSVNVHGDGDAARPPTTGGDTASPSASSPMMSSSSQRFRWDKGRPSAQRDPMPIAVDAGIVGR